MKKIVVIGGGPAGMTAAIFAARNGAEVTIIEHNDRVGKKILATGNGKCNLTNLEMYKECYRSSSNEDYFLIIEDFGPDKLIEFFKELGVATKSKNGYIYPFSEQATTILDSLRFEIKRLGVEVLTETEIININNRFSITTNKAVIKCDKLIIACGGKASPKTGSDGSGYELAQKFGHSLITPIPSLVQIKCKEKFFKELAGVRAEVTLTLTENGKKIKGETGELQLTDYGISGIPVFQMSRFIINELNNKKTPLVHINFCPGFKDKDIKKLLNRDLPVINALNGLVNKKVASVIAKSCQINPETQYNELNENKITKIISLLLDFVVTPTAHNGFENAQVTAGGINLNEIKIDSLESKKTPGLYFAGEILDVDGRCGGYNLQWAFSSGRLAGINAAKKD